MIRTQRSPTRRITMTPRTPTTRIDSPRRRPPPEPSKTTSTTPPTQTPKPPTLDLCVSDPCYSGIFIIDGNIQTAPDIYEAANNNFAIDQCGTDMTFINEGPDIFDCGFQLEIDGKKYTPRKLYPQADDNPCSGHCDTSSNTGLLLYEDLEVPWC
ncbi:uncharacterized protein N7484_006810 [Penicillium longicatenatum]|uniref:uncharacterized protein n=1 Tax=Penicillium longicatenatum TaxID=1561947 RepID=UPI002548B96E|nr:uncharacterized protein N7484_006810 [Penicillium longicatenatum]KAJ5638948.1 hypothetical protein N7484_006810 [Penicillium longicatenatum]